MIWSALVFIFVQLHGLVNMGNAKQVNGHPNIVFILADDIGVADFGYSSQVDDIATPNVDFLAKSGIVLENYYVHALCTPTRASILTGRYSINTGLTSVLIVGTPAGLPQDVPTLPELLLEQNYNTAMVGKWHLGHSQMKMTPTGRGFETFTGNYMWDVDSFTKQMYEDPWSPALLIDWVKSYSNGSYHHYAEARHAMTAIIDESIEVMKTHSVDSSKPLFLYIAYTAAHSPLQPLIRHEKNCGHISHLWRRQFCGMVGSIDESVVDITRAAYEYLGPNTIIVISSDNGGSPWFGGMNFPYRGSKSTPFEGGIKVPGFIIELNALQPISQDKYEFQSLQDSNENSTNYLLANYFKPKHQDRRYKELFHASDWIPTLFGLAGLSNLPSGLDGQDLSIYLPNHTEDDKENDVLQDIKNARNEALLELYLTEDSVFRQDVLAYRLGDMKFIQGSTARDSNWYYPSSTDSINSSSVLRFDSFDQYPDSSLGSRLHKIFVSWKYYIVTKFMENVIRLLAYIASEGALDGFRIVLTHSILQGSYAKLQSVEFITEPYYYKDNETPTIIFNPNITVDSKIISPDRKHFVWLFNLTSDPEERFNIADNHPEIIESIRAKLYTILNQRPEQMKVWYQYHLTNHWSKTHIPGDCSMNPGIKEGECRFTHPWIPDTSDPFVDFEVLVDGYEAARDRLIERLIRIGSILSLVIVAMASLMLLIVKGLRVLTDRGTENQGRMKSD